MCDIYRQLLGLLAWCPSLTFLFAQEPLTHTHSTFTPFRKPPDSAELEPFFNSLSKCGSNAVILSVVPNHSHKYVPTVCRPNYPKSLQSLFDAKYPAMDKANLLECCGAVNVHVTVEMADNLERDTREADEVMIGCDNQDCLIEWFHVKCLNLTDIPQRKWYRPVWYQSKLNKTSLCCFTCIIDYLFILYSLALTLLSLKSSCI